MHEPAPSRLTGTVHVEPVPALLSTLAWLKVLPALFVSVTVTVGRCAGLSTTDTTSSLLLVVRYLQTPGTADTLACCQVRTHL